MEENKPVQNDSTAGENQENQNSKSGAENQQQETQKESEIDSQKVIELLEGSDKALAAAETKIVSLKRENKNLKDGVTGEEDEDLKVKIQELSDEIATLKNKKSDEDLAEIQSARKLNSELIQALKAKNSISNTSLGSNQSKFKQEEDVMKGFNATDIAIFERRASALGISVQEYIKKSGLKN